MTAGAKKVLIIVSAVVGLFMLCVIAGFVLIILPALGRGRAMARRTVCAMNEKELGTMVAFYANENTDHIVPPPSPAFGGTWMCDQATGFTEGLIAAAPGGAGADPQKYFYCPANADQSVAGLWAAAPYRVTGYVWTNDRSKEPGAAMPALEGLRPPPVPLGYHDHFMSTGYGSKTELATDWIISTTNVPASAKWDGITAAGRPGTYGASHMRGSNPEGANVLTYDGHVEWRAFVAANATAVPQGAGGTGPYFWIPNP